MKEITIKFSGTFTAEIDEEERMKVYIKKNQPSERELKTTEE